MPHIHPFRPDATTARRLRRQGLLLVAALAFAGPCIAANHDVRVGNNAGVGASGFSFSPSVLSIAPGDTVTFRNRVYTDNPAHNVVSDDGLFRCARGCDGEGGDGNPTQVAYEFTLAFPNPGTFAYHCEVHDEPGLIIVGDGDGGGDPPPPDTVAIDAGFTGSWYDPAQSGHGFNIEVLPNGGLLVYWYVFDATGNPAWILAQGEIDGTVAILDAYLVAGGAFPPAFDPAAVTRTLWGAITFTFTDCNHGHVAWNTIDPGYRDGEMDVVRLTLPAGLSCP